MIYVRWILIQLFYWTCVLIAIPLYPFAYPFRHTIKSKLNPFWWILHNDPDADKSRWYWTKFGIFPPNEPKGLKRFWISFNWSVFRNGCWRLFNTILKQKDGEKTDIKVIRNDSYDGKNLSPFTVLRMKFKTNGVPTDNVGNELDYELTFQGKNFVKYKIYGTRYFLYSYCRLSDDLSHGKEFTVGWSGKRPLIRNKTFKK